MKKNLLTTLFISLLSVVLTVRAADMKDILGNDPDGFFDIEANVLVNSEAFNRDGFSSAFRWADKEKNALHFLVTRSGLDLYAFGQKLAEAKLSFTNGKISEVFYLFYSRGDTGGISKENFNYIVKQLTGNLSIFMDCEPTTRRERMMKDATLNSCIWVSGKTSCFLRWSARGSHSNFKPEYINVRFEPFDPQNDPRKPGYTVRQKRVLIRGKDDLKNNVTTKEDGTVFIDNIPMVDQGPKGYCVVAVMERLMRYYGNDNFTQHDFANMAQTQTTGGTSIENIKEVIKKIGARTGLKIRDQWSLTPSLNDFDAFLKTYNKRAAKMKKGQVEAIQQGNVVYTGDTMALMNPAVVAEIRRGAKQDYKRFKKAVMNSIDNGIPVTWSVNLSWEPANSRTTNQSGGAHMRLLIGYNEATDELVYSDSWGRGHEFKTIKSMNAWIMTTEYFFIEPR